MTSATVEAPLRAITRSQTASLFGIGECGLPCENDGECQARDPSFVCKSDGGAKRCRPAGCIDDTECEDQRNPDSEFAPWCDVTTHTCVNDKCRAGFDPRLGCGAEKTYQDCTNGQRFKCSEIGTTGFGTCEEKDCIDMGGKELGCLTGQFCDGERYVSLADGSKSDKVVSVDGAAPGQCAPMELNAWCNTTCKTHGDCKDIGPNPTYKDSPSLCTNFGLEDPEASCFWGCEYDQECPSGWHCSSRGLDLDCSFLEGFVDGPPWGMKKCSEDDECGPGNRCVEPKVDGRPARELGFPDMKVCECAGTGVCGGNYTCNAGLGAMEKLKGTPGFEVVKERYCIDASPCGLKGGSCEWFGQRVSVQDPNTGEVVNFPKLTCAATPDGFTGPMKATCPAIDAKTGLPARRGKTASDKYQCVISQVCEPGYMRGPDGLICGVQGQQ